MLLTLSIMSPLAEKSLTLLLFTCNVSSFSVVLPEVEFDRQFYENEFQIKLKP